MSIPLYEYFIISFQIISFFFYIIVILILAIDFYNSTENFNPSFTVLFVFNGISDILSTISILVFRKIVEWNIWHEYFINNNIILYFYKLFFFQSIVLSISGYITITFNRFISIYAPITFKNIWTTKISLVIILSQIIICYLCYVHIFFSNIIYVYDNIVKEWYITTEPLYYSIINNIILLIFCVTGTISNTFLNFLIWKKFKNIFKNQDKENSKHTTIFLYMCITSFFLTIATVQIALRLNSIIIDNNELRNAINNYFFYSLPLLSSLTPFIMILHSTYLRNTIYKFICNIF
uniref:Serpentine receptor class gamma n=1 Tax=Strongyloides stercoralis TaxID=6248 RepID=A0A0K0ED18_STRER